MGVHRLVRRLWAATARVLAAAVVLVVVGVLAYRGVDRVSRSADDRRVTERAQLARVFAGDVADRFETGVAEAVRVAERPDSSSIASVVSAPGSWSTGVLVVDVRTRTVRAASPGLDVRVGADAPVCVRDTAEGPQADDGFWEAARSAASVSGVVRVPGTNEAGPDPQRPTRICRFGVAAIARAGSTAVAAVRDLAALAEDLRGGARRVSAGTRLYLVDRSGLGVVDGVGVTPPARVVEQARSTREARRYVADDARVVQASAVVGGGRDGWTLVLEQDLADFAVGELERPAFPAAAIQAAVVGVAMVLIALFEARRRRAHRRAEEAKSAFFAIAGHELRTPLTALRGFAETLFARWDDLDEARREMLVERMLPQVRRLGRTIEKTLVAANLQGETHTLPVIGSVDVAAVVRPILERFTLEAPLHRFEADIPDDVPTAHADARALEQVLDQVVENAVKYSPSGGTVLVEVRAVRRRVEVSVSDEGVGLPSDHRKIFDPLVQGEEVDRRVHGEGGVGVGLYIARAVLHQMSGSIRAHAREGGGTTFVVGLRAVREPRSQRAAAG